MDIPLLGLAHPHCHPGRNLSVRRGTRWLGVAAARLPLPGGGTSAPLPLQTRSCRFDRLTAADLADEHDPAGRTPAGLLVLMQRHYTGFQPHEVVTLCAWDWPG